MKNKYGGGNFFVIERNEQLYQNLLEAQRLIHSFTALDEEQTKIKASYQKLNEKYQKIWKVGKPSILKTFLFLLCLAIQYEVVYPLSYKYFALYVVTKTLLDQKVYFPFFIIFAMAISYAIVMLIQFSHNKSAFISNDKIAHKNMDIIMRNTELAKREKQVVAQIGDVQRQYVEKCKSWYPDNATTDLQVDYLVRVVGTGEAMDLATACAMLREQMRYDEQMKLHRDMIEEQKRHNTQQERNQIFDTVVRGASSMAMASAMNNQADATRNQNVRVTHTYY